MTYYAGLDVSLKEVSICVVDDDGQVVAQGTAPADPEGVAGWLKNRSLSPKRIVHESGQLSIWLQRGMVQLGLPAICIDARKAHKSLSARLNKSDRADAEGLAQLARMNWFTPVHIRSETSDVGAFLGLTPRRHQSGEMDWSGRVSKCGDATMRGLLFEAGSCVIRQVKRFSTLKFWAVRLAGRRGFRKAAVATARKIAVLMLTLGSQKLTTNGHRRPLPDLNSRR